MAMYRIPCPVVLRSFRTIQKATGSGCFVSTASFHFQSLNIVHLPTMGGSEKGDRTTASLNMLYVALLSHSKVMCFRISLFVSPMRGQWIEWHLCIHMNLLILQRYWHMMHEIWNPKTARTQPRSQDLLHKLIHMCVYIYIYIYIYTYVYIYIYIYR